jgi:hypothetical protein
MEARLFAEHEIPWDEIAFRTVSETLKLYFADSLANTTGPDGARYPVRDFSLG